MKAILAAAFAVLFAFPVSAAQECGPAAQVYQLIAGQYAETEIESRWIRAPQNPDVMVYLTVWANATTGTWSFTGILPNGVMCIFAYGADYGGQMIDDFLGERA